MSILEFCSLGIALGTDSFSVSVGMGMGPLGWRRILRISLLFSLLQVLLLTIGCSFSTLVDFLLEGGIAATGGAWLQGLHQLLTMAGGAILLVLGGKMVQAYFQPPAEARVYYMGWRGLLLLAVGVSIDALTAGFGLGMLSTFDLRIGASIVGLVIWLMAVVGLTAGRCLNRLIGQRMELCGGLLLMALALHFLWTAL
ncbi:MAG: manganese efflux pump MntP family protein [Limnochordia bacterium]